MQEVQKSALEAMTDLLLQQLEELGEASHGHANLAGRTDRNINDVVRSPPPKNKTLARLQSTIALKIESQQCMRTRVVDSS